MGYRRKRDARLETLAGGGGGRLLRRRRAVLWERLQYVLDELKQIRSRDLSAEEKAKLTSLALEEFSQEELQTGLKIIAEKRSELADGCTQ